MKIGAVYPQTELKGDPIAVGEFARAAEELGYTHLVAYDHIVGATHDREPKLDGPYTEIDPFHEPLIMFAYLAGITKTLEFMTGIMILPQRQTVLAAKQIADLDLLSGERLRIGVGVGWNYVEYDALGQDFKTRGKRLDEQVGFMRRLWSEPLVTFQGRFDRIDRACLIPRPKRLVPIWMGGHSEPAFRRAANIGDGFIFVTDINDTLSGLDQLERHLGETGRTEGFGKEFLVRFGRDPAKVAERIRKWRDRGGTHASVASMGRGFTDVKAHIDFIAEVKNLVN